ncbi:MAG: hypothetical protein IJ575_05080 [Selenomonadaceae bacterium]|nr:hypothetical protein [Selenomonadaceae bacterium]
MKKSISRFVAMGLCTTMLSFAPMFTAPAFAEDGEMVVSKVLSGHAYVPEGTDIEVEFNQTISSKEVQEGDRISMKLVSNLIINDVIVAPAGTKIVAKITKAKKASSFGRGGKLEFKITSFKTLNNVEVPLEFSRTVKGGKDTGAYVATYVTIVGGFFMKGKNVTIEKGTRFTAIVAQDIDLNVSVRDLPYAMKSNN